MCGLNQRGCFGSCGHFENGGSRTNRVSSRKSTIPENEEEEVKGRRWARGERVAIYAIKSAPQNCGDGERNSVAVGGLCVIQGIDPRSFLNALFRSFFLLSPSSSHPRWRSFKSHEGEENAKTRLLRDNVTRFSSQARTRDVPFVRARRFSITDKHNIAIASPRRDTIIMNSGKTFPPSRKIFIRSYSELWVFSVQRIHYVAKRVAFWSPVLSASFPKKREMLGRLSCVRQTFRIPQV